jgi:hypothetical protein
MIIDRPLMMTHHFRQRLRSYNMPIWRLFQILPLATKTKAPQDGFKRYKDNLHHVEYGPWVFTYSRTKDLSEKQLGNIYLMITLFDKRMNLSNNQLEKAKDGR